jgi:hypothetical protein
MSLPRIDLRPDDAYRNTSAEFNISPEADSSVRYTQGKTCVSIYIEILHVYINIHF